MSSGTDIGNTSWVKDQVKSLLQANQSCYDSCENLRQCYDKIRNNWDSTTVAVNYMEKLDANIEKMYKMTSIISDLGEYINKYIDDSIAASNKEN